MSVVTNVWAWEALDSRGSPTVAVKILLADGTQARALAPSGASTGRHEARELRDGGERYGGRGVRHAVNNVMDTLAPAVLGEDVKVIDDVLAAVDPSPGFETVGANAVLAVSIAGHCAAAASADRSLARHLAGDSAPLLLPMPMVNVVSGGAHANSALDIQDCLVVPFGASSFSEAVQWAAAVRDAAIEIAEDRGHSHARLVADEGGIGVALRSNREALEVVTGAIERAGLRPGEQAGLALDLAATQFHKEGRYHLAREGRELDAAELVAEVACWCEDFPVASVEDILAEDDWGGWRHAMACLGDRVDLVGDDLFVTQADRLERGIAENVANSVLIKVNQNGLLSSAQRVLRRAQQTGYRTIVSARSGETEESWLADLAVGWRAGQIKVGSTHRSERTAKWNRLLELEATEQTIFAGPWVAGRPERTQPHAAF